VEKLATTVQIMAICCGEMGESSTQNSQRKRLIAELMKKQEVAIVTGFIRG
jgi:aspartokinase